MMVGARRRARKGEGERLREDIIAATEKLLLATGDQAAVSIRGIADACGCTPPAIYLHFPDKTHLIHAVCERHFLALDAAIEAAGAGIDDPIEALLRRGRAYAYFGIANPEPYRIIFMGRKEAPPSFAEETQHAGEQTFQHLVEAVQRCIDAGRMRPADPALVATGLWAAIHGLTSLVISMPGFPPGGVDELLDHLLATMLAGLTA